jgi:hypothetical protein
MISKYKRMCRSNLLAETTDFKKNGLAHYSNGISMKKKKTEQVNQYSRWNTVSQVLVIYIP